MKHQLKGITFINDFLTMLVIKPNGIWEHIIYTTHGVMKKELGKGYELKDSMFFIDQQGHIFIVSKEE